MDVRLILADSKNKAPQASLRSPDFRRMLRMTAKHRRYLFLGLGASVFYGLLQSVSIVGVLPVLKAILAEEGFHGWVNRTVAEERLGVKLAPAEDGDFQGEAGSSARPAGRGSGDAGVEIVELDARSVLTEHDVQRLDRITDLDGRALSGLELVDALVRAGDTVMLGLLPAPRAGREDTSPRTMDVRLHPVSSKGRALLRAASIVPSENRRQDRVTTLFYVLGAVVVLALLSNVARFVAEYFTAISVLRGIMDLRRKLYSKVLRLPMDFFNQNVSDLVSRFVQDSQEIQRGMTALFGRLLREPFKAIFLLAAALYLDARMTLTMLVVVPLAVVIFWYVGRRIRNANRRLLQIYGMMIGALSSSLGAIAIVKAYNAEHVERRNLWRIDRKTLRQQLKIARLEAVLNPLLEVLGIVFIAIVTIWLGSQVINRRIELEYFITLVIALAMLSDPLKRVADVYPRVVRSAAGAQRIFAVLDMPAESELREGGAVLPPLCEAIELRNVTFRYSNAPEPALRNVSLRVSKGETVAIVGPNGSGKTTLTRLLLRFYDPDSGEVLVDGRDVREGTLRSLRRQFSVVSQDPVVFALSLAENIAYGTRHASRDRIIDAAQRAHAEEFIQEKAGGYEELAGERGATLSGGQRQRLCIARAIMRNAPVLIFDEATSQVDSESERKIQLSLAELARDRTTIIIAHRLSTIRFATRIIVMDEGRILDSGTHEELAERCPLYRTLCETQLAA